MPSLRIWFGALLCCVGPLGFAAQAEPTAPNPVKAPEQPSAALLEFIGDWNEDERQLIGMEKQLQDKTHKQDRKVVRRAP